jgi:CheY-like chemotaxis protein
LVVDDNLINRLVPGLLLKSFYPLVEVFDIDGGDDILKYIELHRITHVLLDISMPRLDGLQIARSIKNHPLCSTVCVIAYTADVALAANADYASLGFDSVLLKPVERLRLYELLGL